MRFKTRKKELDMSQKIHVSTQRPQVDLFTPEEHRVLAEWFGADPPAAAAGCALDEALERLGIVEQVHELYTDAQAAVALIVLEGAEERLPNFEFFDGKHLSSARALYPKKLMPQRKVAMVSRHLFTVNWAESGPGFSWPGAYYATWVPFYERYVVTHSYDSSEVIGYCDVAIGHFGPEEELTQGSQRVITKDWRAQWGQYGQGRWAYFISEGLVQSEEAKAWADDVWSEGGEQ